MIWTQNDLDDFLGMVSSPSEKKSGSSDQIPFIDALALALTKKPGTDNKPLFEALQKKYPEAVEAHMKEAQKIADESA